MGCRNSDQEASSCFSLHQINKKIEQELIFSFNISTMTVHMYTVTEENITKNGRGYK